MTNMQEIEEMTIVEYLLRMEAYRLQQVDQTLQTRNQAWAMRAVNSVNEKGEYIFQSFKDFFDYDAAIKEIQQPVKPESEMDSDLVAIAKRLQKFRGKEVKHG